MRSESSKHFLKKIMQQDFSQDDENKIDASQYITSDYHKNTGELKNLELSNKSQQS